MQWSNEAGICCFCRIRSSCQTSSRSFCRILKLLLPQKLLFYQMLLLHLLHLSSRLSIYKMGKIMFLVLILKKKPNIDTPNKLNWSENPIHHIYCSTFNLQRSFCKLPDLKGRFWSCFCSCSCRIRSRSYWQKHGSVGSLCLAHRELAWLFHEPHTELVYCLKILPSCFSKKRSASFPFGVVRRWDFFFFMRYAVWLPGVKITGLRPLNYVEGDQTSAATCFFTPLFLTSWDWKKDGRHPLFVFSILGIVFLPSHVSRKIPIGKI